MVAGDKGSEKDRLTVGALRHELRRVLGELREREAKAAPKERRRQAKREASWFLLGVLVSLLLTYLAPNGHVFLNQPCLEAEGRVVPLYSLVRDPAAPLGILSIEEGAVDLDQEGGSLYLYRQRVVNTGEADAHDLAIRLSLPGVPLIARSVNRAEAEVEAGTTTVTGRLLLPNGTLVERTVEQDPRSVRTPLPTAFVRNVTFISSRGNTSADAELYRDEWVIRVVAASGPTWVTYRLPRLPAGETWEVQTFYFGARSTPESGGALTAAAEGFGGTTYYRNATLGATDAAHGPTVYGEAPRADLLSPMCTWPRGGWRAFFSI